jgi:peptidoglycan/xylan/chitin deacetylase (PgdA/CDA1 family)
MAHRLPVLMFHAIEDSGDTISFPPALFEQGIDQLHAHGYQALRLADVPAGRWPARAVALTFDDGYQSVFRTAFPVLRRRGFTATVFLTTGAIGTSADPARPPHPGRRSMLSWPEIQEMRAAGFSFGAHTHTHPNLTRLPPGQSEREMVDSRRIIEDQLGEPVRLFAYPFGQYNRTVRDLARRHFELACSDRLGLVTGRSDPHALERVETFYFRSPRRWNLLRSAVLPWWLGALRLPRAIRRAVTTPPGAAPG